MKNWKKSTKIWLFIATSCLVIGFLFAKLSVDIANDAANASKKQLESLSLENVDLAAKNDLLLMRTIEQASQIENLLTENQRLNVLAIDQAEKIYFYKRVISPDEIKKGIEISSFTVSPSTKKDEHGEKSEKPKQWNYELVLMQSQKGRRFLKGRYEIILSYFEGEDKTLKKIALTDLNKKLGNKFKFKYFQTLTGQFELPKNFTVDEVNINLKVPGNRWQRTQSVSEHIEWDALVSPSSAFEE